MITIESVEEIKTSNNFDIKVVRRGNSQFISYNGIPLEGTINKSSLFYDAYIKGFKEAMKIK